MRSPEDQCLRREDLPSLSIDLSVIRRHLSSVTTHIKKIAEVWKNRTIPVDRSTYIGAIKPLKCSAAKAPTTPCKGKVTGAPKAYSWWDHFLLDCGYSKDSSRTSMLREEPFFDDNISKWKAYLVNAIGLAGPIEYIPYMEQVRTLKDVMEAMTKAARVIGLKP